MEQWIYMEYYLHNPDIRWAGYLLESGVWEEVMKDTEDYFEIIEQLIAMKYFTKEL